MPIDYKNHIAICDDVKEDRIQIASMTKEILKSEEIPCSITEYDSAKALLDGIHSGTQYSILLLDVMMDELDGIELARLLRAEQDKTDIIFISINREIIVFSKEIRYTIFNDKYGGFFV